MLAAMLVYRSLYRVHTIDDRSLKTLIRGDTTWNF